MELIKLTNPDGTCHAQANIDGFQEGYKIGKFESKLRLATYVMISFFLGLVVGYYLCVTALGTYESKAETDLNSLETEFHESWEKPRSFLIFNRQFKISPVDTVKKAFHYKKVTYAGASSEGERRTWEK